MAVCGVDTICADPIEKMHTHIHCEPCWREMAAECQTTETKKTQVTHRILSETPFLSDMGGSKKK
jgi:hypothetical protein